MKRHVLLLLCLIAVFVQTAQAADTWLSVRSKNFFLVGNATESAIKRVARNFEEFRSAFTTLFPGVADRDSVPTIVIVFKDDASFRPFKPLYNGKPGNVAGYFQPGSDVNFIGLTGGSATPHTIYHEYVHALTKDGKSPLPLWVGEGLAEVYSTLQTQAGGKEVMVGTVVSQHIVTLNNYPLMPFDSFLAVEHGSPFYNEQTKQGIFYAQSWAFVHYLMLANDRARAKQLNVYVSLLAAGKSREESFAQAFQTDYSSIEKELRTYTQGRMTWPAVKFTLNEKLDVEKEMQVAPLTEGRAEFYLGDLLLHTNRLEEAEAHLQKAITLDLAFPGTYASMGLLRIRQQRHGDALTFLTRAVESDSQNYLAHYYYATMLEQEKDSDEDARQKRFQLMRTHLKRSIELAPRYVEAYRMLGYVSLVLRDELSETEALLHKAVALSPGRHELSIDLAQVMLANNKTAAARVLLGPLKNSADPEVRDRATQMLDNIEARLQYEQDVRDYERQRAIAQANEVPDSDSDSRKKDFSDAGPPALKRAPEPTRVPVPGAPRQTGPYVEGLLTLIDCLMGLTLEIRVGNGMVQLHTDNPDSVEFSSNVPTIKDSIACGPLNSPVPVTVTYRRTADPKFFGEPIRILFVGNNQK